MKPYPSYRIRNSVLVPVFFVLALVSCIREEFNADVLDNSVRFSPGVAAPIGHVHYQLEELFRDSILPEFFTVDARGFITLRYHEEIASLRAEDLFIIDDVHSEVNIINNTGSPIILDDLDSSLTLQDTIRIPFQFTGAPGAEMDSILLDSMDLRYSATSGFEGLVSIYGPFSSGIQLNGGSVSQSLSNLSIRLEHIPPERNELVIVYLVTLLHSSGTIPQGGTIASLSIEFTNMDYSSVYGYLGQFNIPVPNQSLSLDLYDPIPQGVFHFEDATLKIGISNSFGIPVQVEMTSFQSTGRDGQVSFFTGDSVPSQVNPRLINYPLIGQEGQEIEDSIVLTSGNSNLLNVLETAPGDITYGAYGTCNPGGVTHSNFLLDTSRVRISAELTLPLSGYADFLLITDTLDFIFHDFYNHPPEEIKNLTFRLNFINGLPVNVYFQAYFADQNGMILDSLFTDLQDSNRLVPGAPDKDGDGKADPLMSGPVEVEINRDRIGNISTARYIIIYGRFSTVGFEDSPPDIVRFYTDYFFTAYLGAITEVDVNSSDYQ